MVDLTQNWYSYMCPMLNWFIPMKYIEISSEEFSNINTFKMVIRIISLWF
ncbi:DUF443 family protein [Staphylococcus aureus]|nr:DUF443 family protein [Staphylococcus aureus]